MIISIKRDKVVKIILLIIVCLISQSSEDCMARERFITKELMIKNKTKDKIQIKVPKLNHTQPPRVTILEKLAMV